MTCGLYGGLEVRFLGSDFSITPLEANTRSQHKEFSYTKCKVRREDGQYIANNALSFEPVELRLDGVVQDRYMFHPEAVDLNNDDASLTLYDGEKVLEEGGTLNHHFQENTLGEVIDYIIGQRQDPNRVIKGVRHPSEAVEDIAVASPGGGGLLGWVWDGALDKYEKLRKLEDNDTSLKFKKTTPYGALKKTASAFALDTWVDADGYLNYGFRGGNPNSFTIGPDDRGVRLKEYNVTVGSGKLAEVILRGRYHYTKNDPNTGPYGFTSPSVYAYGKASLVDASGSRIPGRTIEREEPVGATNPSSVEDVARRVLIQHYMERKSGNMVLNGGSSIEKEKLIGLAVGDLIEVRAEIEEHCQRDVDTGIFVVQGVQHNLDKRRGWLVDVGVAALPESDIASESWLENPDADIRWESVDDHGQAVS